MTWQGDQSATADHPSSGTVGKPLFTSSSPRGIMTVSECSSTGLTMEQQHALIEVLKALDGMRTTVRRILNL